MPREEYDEIEEFEEVDEIDEFEEDDDFEEVEELHDVDEVEEVEEVAEVKDDDEKGRRHLRRGRLSEFSDKLAGGAARPGEESVKKSPFVMVMWIALIGLGLLAIIFGLMILSEGERRSFDAAMAKLKEQAYPEAEKRLMTHLQAYADGEFENQARIALHKARVQKYCQSGNYTVAQTKEGVFELNEFTRVCRDMPEFADEKENVRRFAEHLARVGALVAEDQKSNEALEQSLAATAILEAYYKPEEVPLTVANDLKDLQRKAEAAILKDGKLKEYMAEIQGHLDAENTFAALSSRQALIDRYDSLNDDAEISKILAAILKKEKELTLQEDVGREAIREEIPVSNLTPASLSLRTQSSVDAVSRGTLVFAVGLDSCWGLDAETGVPIWKRSIGNNAAFAPVEVDASTPSLLVYHGGLSQLLLLEQKTGKLIWRQTIESRPAGPPLIFQQQIYLTTVSGELWRLSVDTGKAISRVIFRQPVIGPPALTRDQKHLVIAGDQSVIYTLTVNPFECVAVSYVEHRLGSVEAPMLTMGKILLLCDNDEDTVARLRVLDLNSETGEVTVRRTDEPITVLGQVRDTSLLRGTELFVPSTPQRVTAFSVNDSPDADPPLSRIGANQLENASTTPVHLLAGPQGQLWMASEALRKFNVRTNAVELETASAAQGVHRQPIQFKDQNVFVTTNEPYSSSVFFSKVDPQQMEGRWRTVVGTHVVAAGPTNNNESLLAVSDFGDVFRVPLQSIKAGDFILDQVSRHSLPDKLKDPVGGLELKDGRLASFCGGDEPAIWTFAPSGQLEQRWPIQAAPQTQPISLADGIVVALPGRLQMVANSSGARVQDYRAAQGVEKQTNWKSLVALNENQALAITSDNVATRVEYRPSPRPHLTHVSDTPLQQSVDLRPTAAGDLLAVCTSEGNLQAMATATLEILGETPLGAVASASPHVSGDRIFVEVSRRDLKVFGRSPDLPLLATIPLNNRFLVGPPLNVGDGFIICLSDGEVLTLDGDGKATGKTISLGQNAQKGPIAVGRSIIVIGLDGSLYSIEDLLN